MRMKEYWRGRFGCCLNSNSQQKHREISKAKCASKRQTRVVQAPPAVRHTLEPEIESCAACASFGRPTARLEATFRLPSRCWRGATGANLSAGATSPQAPLRLQAIA